MLKHTHPWLWPHSCHDFLTCAQCLHASIHRWDGENAIFLVSAIIYQIWCVGRRTSTRFDLACIVSNSAYCRLQCCHEEDSNAARSQFGLKSLPIVKSHRAHYWISATAPYLFGREREYLRASRPNAFLPSTFPMSGTSSALCWLRFK